jgi:uncharacterized protein YggE
VRTLIPFLILAVGGYAQVDGISTTASRNLTLNPDEVTFYVSLTTELGTTLEEAVASMQDTGITAKQLLGITSTPEYYGPPPQTRTARVAYQFFVTHPYGRLKEVADKLETARKAVVANNGDLQFTLYVSASEKAIEDNRQQLLPQLIAEARKKAELLANAAGMTLGPVLNVSESVYPATGVPGPAAAFISPGPGSFPSPIRVNYSVFTRFGAQAR